MQIKGAIVELMVQNVDQSIHFYQEVLGFSLVASDQENAVIYWAELELGHFRLALKDEAKQRKEAVFFRHTPIGASASLCFIVDDINIAYAKVKQQFQTLNYPHLTPCGIREFSMKDLDGYVITIEQI